MDQEISTVPVKAKETALVQEPKKVVPAYIWKTGKTLFLSRKEKVVADTYLETRSYAECERALAGIGVKRDWITCKRWMEKPHIKAYLEEQFEERGLAAGWTKERWLYRMTQHLRGEDRLKPGDLYAMKLIADILGFEPQESASTNLQINITQSNGRA